MRKIVATEFYTLDGLMSDPEDRMEWVLGTFNAEMGQYEGGIYDSADTLLLGAVTYKIFEGYWPNAADDPNTAPGEVEMAHKMNQIRKIVYSKSIRTVTWQNSELRPEIDAAELQRMKQAPGKDMIVVGSASIVQQLTDLGLVDEYHLLLHPVILGKGKPLFKGIREGRSLALVGTEDFGNGVVLLKYKSST
jgi:dihydrofolate reductase